ncbi:hypothetical protein IKQ21_08210 [bacterium]|nr:hypothetical protein [bacterium]
MKVPEINSYTNTSFCAHFSKADINKLIYSARNAYGWNNPSALPKLYTMLSHIEKLPFKSVTLTEYPQPLKDWNGKNFITIRYQILNENGETLGRGVNPYFALINSTVKGFAEEITNFKQMTKSVFTRKWKDAKNVTEDDIKKFAINI